MKWRMQGFHSKGPGGWGCNGARGLRDQAPPSPAAPHPYYPRWGWRVLPDRLCECCVCRPELRKQVQGALGGKAAWVGGTPENIDRDSTFLLFSFEKNAAECSGAPEAPLPGLWRTLPSRRCFPWGTAVTHVCLLTARPPRLVQDGAFLCPLHGTRTGRSADTKADNGPSGVPVSACPPLLCVLNSAHVAQ